MTMTQLATHPWSRRLLPLALAAMVAACSDGKNDKPDAGIDAGTDAGMDAGSDAGVDAGSDAGTDPAACEAEDPLALGRCVDPEKYQTDLTFVAQPRPKGSAHLAAVQDLCATRLESLGFTVERQAYGTGTNVIGVRAGTQADGPRVLIGAHYDSTDATCPGADDNATGVAGMLEAARVLSQVELPGTLIAACWDEEELGLIGSRAYAERARTNNDRIDAHFNFEMIGYTDDAPNSQRLPEGLGLLFPAQVQEIEANDNRGEFITAIAEPGSAQVVANLERYADALGLPFIGLVIPQPYLTSPAIRDLRRSDHAAFWDSDYPGIMLTDTSEFRYTSYHCRDGADEIAKLDRDFTAQVLRMTVAAAAESLGF